MAFFVGEFETTIDGKRRLAISSEFRQQIVPEQDGQGLILTLGPDKHLWIYPDLYYKRLMATLKRSPLPSRESSKLTIYFATARTVQPDSQGRIVLPEKSMSRATVAEQVTLVGSDDHLEIWPTTEWQQRMDAGLSTYGEDLYEASDRLSAEREPNTERKP